jgi:hypothetical protein
MIVSAARSASDAMESFSTRELMADLEREIAARQR